MLNATYALPLRHNNKHKKEAPPPYQALIHAMKDTEAGLIFYLPKA